MISNQLQLRMSSNMDHTINTTDCFMDGCADWNIAQFLNCRLCYICHAAMPCQWCLRPGVCMLPVSSPTRQPWLLKHGNGRLADGMSLHSIRQGFSYWLWSRPQFCCWINSVRALKVALTQTRH